MLVPFLIPVEEEFVFPFIETDEWQIDRAADVVTGIVVAVEWPRRSPVVAEGLGLGGVAEIVVRVQTFIAMKVAAAAVKFPRPALRDNRNKGPASPTILGLEVGG